MTTKLIEKAELVEDRNALLEKTLIAEYLKEQGYSFKKLKELSDRVVKQLMKEATRYAALRMEEIKAKAHFVDEIVGGSTRRN